MGQWNNNKIQGIGIFLYPDGKIYRGEYNNDSKHGYGITNFVTGQ